MAGEQVDQFEEEIVNLPVVICAERPVTVVELMFQRVIVSGTLGVPVFWLWKLTVSWLVELTVCTC